MPSVWIKTWSDIVVLLLPILSGYFLRLKCPIEQEKIQPLNPYYFEVIWPILYILSGYAWFWARQYASGSLKLGGGSNIPIKVLIDLMFLLHTSFANGWIYYFLCKFDKRSALWMLNGLVFATIAIIYYSAKSTALPSLLLIPYLVWMLFAQQWNKKVLDIEEDVEEFLSST